MALDLTHLIGDSKSTNREADENLMIKLVFAGDVITGFERSQVISQLAKLLKRDETQIRRMLFSGKAVVVKKVATDEEAYKWRKAFANAGAVLMVSAGDQEPADTAPDDESVAAGHSPKPAAVEPGIAVDESLDENAADANDSAVTGAVAEEPTLASEASRSPGIRRRNKVYVLLGALVLVAIALTVFVLWISRPLWQGAQLDDQQQRWAEALASPDTYALAHVDVARAVQLEGLAGTQADLPSPVSGDDDFWQSLARAGIDVRKQIAHMWLAGTHSAKHTGAVIVLSGVFSPDKVKSWLGERYTIESESEEGLMFRTSRANACDAGTTMRAVIGADRIIVGDPASVEQLQMRLEQKAPASQSLQRWQEVSANQLASLAVFIPENIGEAAGGMSGMMLKSVGAAAQPAEGLYLDLEPVAVPPGVELRTQVFSQDAEFINNSYQAFDERIAEWRAEAKKNWPEVAGLYDRLEVTRSDDSVGATVFFDRHLQRDVSRWVSSIFSGMLSSPGEAPTEEQLESNPPVFTNVASAEVKPYASYSDFHNSFFTPTAETGPFAIAVESLTLNDQQQLEIALKTLAYNLPNAPTRGSAASMTLVDVLDAQGQSLLPTVECGEDKNLAPSEIGSSMTSTAFVDGEQVTYTSTQGSKAIALDTGVSASDVAEVKGYIDYRQVNAIEKIVLQQPLAGQVIERNGLMVRFMDAGKHALQYRYSGEVDNLLHVAALNKDGKALSSGSAMWGGTLIGSGKTASVDYHGEVDRIEVVIAKNAEVKRYPVSINTVWPAVNNSLFGAKALPLADPDAVQKALKATQPPSVTYSWQKPVLETVAGPATLAFQSLEFDDRFGMNISFSAYLSNGVPLVGALGAGAVRLTALEFANSEPQALANTVYFPFVHDGGYWMNGEYQPDEQKPWIKGDATFRDRDTKVTSPERIQGELLLNVPDASHVEEFAFEIGATWQDEGLSLQVTEFNPREVILSFNGNVSRVVAVRAKRNGELVSDPAKMRNMFGEAGIVLALNDRPDTLELELADSLTTERYPFEVNLAEVAAP